jgi:putative lipoic acid-binding regulatory protein
MKQALSIAAATAVTSCSSLTDAFVLTRTLNLLHSMYSCSSSVSTSVSFMTPPDGPPAGSFFHQVPNDEDDEDFEDEVMEDLLGTFTLDAQSSATANQDRSPDDNYNTTAVPAEDFDGTVFKLIRQQRKKPLASQPSTINGVPTAGFGKRKVGGKYETGTRNTSFKKSSSYVAIGPKGTVTPPEPINDPSRPQLDDQGYTLYTNEETGEKSRVFEALVDYPCVFTMKIVGSNDGSFVEDILAVVADATDSEMGDISHSTKAIGKWTSVTVQAEVQSSEMLYTLYEKVDLDPRVKFKF